MSLFDRVELEERFLDAEQSHAACVSRMRAELELDQIPDATAAQQVHLHDERVREEDVAARSGKLQRREGTALLNSKRVKERILTA